MISLSKKPKSETCKREFGVGLGVLQFGSDALIGVVEISWESVKFCIDVYISSVLTKRIQLRIHHSNLFYSSIIWVCKVLAVEHTFPEPFLLDKLYQPSF